jgi:predicted amidohydrolase
MNPLLASKILEDHHLKHPDLEVLAPTLAEYSVLLHQPQGNILVSPQGIRNRDEATATASCKRLLEHAAQNQIRLVVTPEYSTPWQALVETLIAGHAPPVGCLWALGCESLTVAQLDQLQAGLQTSARVVSVPFDREAAADKKFLDPLAYVFRTHSDDGADAVVVLIQFKTHPCIDDGHIEIANLALGANIIVFGNVGTTVRLFAFICSDVLAHNIQNLLALFDASLVLHIQLNPKPRESAYRDYRKRLFGYHGDRTELICLNWAALIRCWTPGATQPDDWENIGGSAWHLRPDRFDCKDNSLIQNHRRGLYYTWHETPKCNVLFLNFESGAYCFVATKVWQHLVPAVQAKRTGPRLERVIRWDSTTGTWQSVTDPEDGFEKLISHWAIQAAPLKAIYINCPIAAERLLALLKGEILHSTTWHLVRQLKSFGIGEGEYIWRITFAQDTDSDCVSYREAHVRHFVSCRQILDTWTKWPPELEDFAAGYDFIGDVDYPNSSVRSAANKRATLIYAGENPTADHLKALGDALRAALMQIGQPAERLGIFHRNGNDVMLWRHPDAPRYDKPDNASPKNFTDAT